MSNGHDPMRRFSETMRSKAAIEAAKAYRKYCELRDAGWPSDQAFLVAFMGVHLFFVPELKPLPEPDPPFELKSLQAELKVARKRVVRLLKDIEADLAFLKAHRPKPGAKR